jgi:hypothetical protein
MSGSHLKGLVAPASDAPEDHRFLPVPQSFLTILTRNDVGATINAPIALREAAVRGCPVWVNCAVFGPARDVSLVAQTGLQFDLRSAQGKLIASLMAAPIRATNWVLPGRRCTGTSRRMARYERTV